MLVKKLMKRWHSTCRLFSSNEGRVKRKCVAYKFGEIPYEVAWGWQKQLLSDRFANKHSDDAVLILQHPNVYTIGRGGSYDNVKFNPSSTKTPDGKSNYQLLKVDRGGEVTYHGPGQLVVYPILDLNFHKKDLHWYLRQVEDVVIRVLGKFGLEGERVEGLTGVWVNGAKIAAVGTHASKWITMHGFAINVTTDLSYFDNIVPCGIEDKSVSSMHQHIPHIDIKEVEEVVIDALAETFNLDITPKFDAKDPFPEQKET